MLSLLLKKIRKKSNFHKWRNLLVLFFILFFVLDLAAAV